MVCRAQPLIIAFSLGQARTVHRGRGGTCPPKALGGGGTGGAPTGGRLLYKTAFRFNRLEVNVLYEVY